MTSIPRPGLRDAAPTIVENLARGRRRFADRPLLEAPYGTVTTYGVFAELVEGAAERLASEGLRPGDRLALAARNGLDAAVAIWACARGGFVYVGLPTNLRATQWSYLLRHAGVSLALAESEFAEQLGAAGVDAGLPADRVRGLGDHVTGRRRPWRDETPMPDPEATYAVVYTSGTTGRPKAAQICHRMSMHAARFYTDALRLAPEDKTAIHLPFHYVSGHITQLNPVMAAGGSAVAMPEFSAAKLVELIRDDAVTFLDVVPTIFSLLLHQRDFALPACAGLRVAAFGGAPMPTATLAELRARLPDLALHNVYGMSETAGVICALPAAESASMPESVGRTIPGVQVRLVDDDGREVPTGSPGELWVRGPIVTPGYLGDQEATTAAITGGWLHTGDYARVDDTGYVFVLDRKKDMIIRAGNKIYPVELEALLSGHPDIAEATVAGIPDGIAGEAVAVWVVPAPGGAVTPAEVKRWVRARMSDQAVPRYVAIVEAIPRNQTGKVDKKQLRELATGGGP
jgi:acyl-CoA synthetase (AMP-forming)/AMP-acid ligase II